MKIKSHTFVMTFIIRVEQHLRFGFFFGDLQKCTQNVLSSLTIAPKTQAQEAIKRVCVCVCCALTFTHARAAHTFFTERFEQKKNCCCFEPVL